MIKIRAFINGWNDRCQPFVWTKTADQILTKASTVNNFSCGPLAAARCPGCSIPSRFGHLFRQARRHCLNARDCQPLTLG